MHELFEQRVRAHPDAIAAIRGDRQWTYAELNARANRLARALLARGLRREGVVAVVTERNLDWMAAVLAIFKAGGVYLPIEPHFPADRIARTLSRAGCELVLTEPGSTATLGPALEGMPGVELLFAEDAYAEDHADGDLGIEVGPDQLAYIYFTSGSTGEPKGAMCEHAGMLNHLYAKIEDLEIGAGQVVAQTAPQCFDISMWQLVSALLAGGRTLIVEQEVILDVARFVDTIADGRVNVLQVVPSYLEVVLSYLDQNPRELPDLRYVSVTGEALKRELAQRWFAAKPGIKLVNAYGLTETSDDTNHEVMDRAPDGERVPLGRAGQQRARLRGGRGPEAGAARHRRPDRLLRGLRRPRVHQRPRAHRAVLPDRPAPRGPAALPGRRLRPLAAGRQAGVPRPPGQPGQDQRLPHRDRRDREHPAAGARRPRRRGGGRRGGPARASGWWPSTRGRGRSRPVPCGTGWARRCPGTWSRRPSTGGRACR